MKKLLALVLSLATLFTVSSAVIGCDKSKDDVLVVGYTIYPPMNYFDDANSFVGFDTELALEVGKLIGKKIEFVEIDWDNKAMALDTKEIDAVWNGMTITAELQEAMAITEPYLENKQVIVCQKSVAAQYQTKESLLAAAEVLVEGGSAGESVAKAVGVAASKLLTVDGQRDTLLEVKTSASKVAIVDLTMAKVVTGEGTSFSDLTYVDVGFELEQFGIGFRKGDVALKDQVNEAINTLKANGKFAELQAKYFS